MDLTYLYAARVEAQRAADAAADAAAVGNANYVAGGNPGLDPTTFSDTCPAATSADGCFDMSQPADPRVTVIVRRTAAHGNPLRLFFMSLFGVQTADVSAVGMAEAYNPSPAADRRSTCRA